MSAPPPDEPSAEAVAYARALTAEALRALEDAGLVRPAPSLLDMSRLQMERLALQGFALGWLVNRPEFETWRTRPRMRLSEVIKRVPRANLVEIATELGKVGIHDLDELLLPDDSDLGACG